jgi:hypothetical protein
MIRFVEDALSDDAGKTRRSAVRDQEIQLKTPMPQD